MEANKVVLGVVGSPNREGALRTNWIKGCLGGSSPAGATHRNWCKWLIMSWAACKDCLSRVCQENQKCTFEIRPSSIWSQKSLTCGGLVLGTTGLFLGYEVEWIKYFILRCPRICSLGPLIIGAAGGRDQHCWRTRQRLDLWVAAVYHFLQMLQMRVL